MSMDFHNIRQTFRRATPPPPPPREYSPAPAAQKENGWDMMDYAGAAMLVGWEGAAALSLLDY